MLITIAPKSQKLFSTLNLLFRVAREFFYVKNFQMFSFRSRWCFSLHFHFQISHDENHLKIYELPVLNSFIFSLFFDEITAQYGVWSFEEEKVLRMEMYVSSFQPRLHGKWCEKLLKRHEKCLKIHSLVSRSPFSNKTKQGSAWFASKWAARMWNSSDFSSVDECGGEFKVYERG